MSENSPVISLTEIILAYLGLYSIWSWAGFFWLIMTAVILFLARHALDIFLKQKYRELLKHIKKKLRRKHGTDQK